MKTIRFELKDDHDTCPENGFAEIEVLGDCVEDYLRAFKAFLISISFTEKTVMEIQMMEDAFHIFEKENK